MLVIKLGISSILEMRLTNIVIPTARLENAEVDVVVYE